MAKISYSMTLRTNSATRRRVVSRSSVVLTTSATSRSRGSTWVGATNWAGLELTAFILAAASGPLCALKECFDRALPLAPPVRDSRLRRYPAGFDSARHSPAHIRRHKHPEWQ